MADISYRLLVNMSASGSLSPQLGALGSQAQGVDNALSKIGSSATSAFGAVGNAIENIGDKVAGIAVGFAKLAAVGAGAAISYGVVGLNNELEKTTLSLGAIFNAQGIAAGMPAGMELAKNTIRDMRKDAAALPGEFKDLLSFFKLGATPGFQLGASTKQLEKMSAMGMAAAAATGVNMDQAAREYAQLLQGRAGAHNVFGSMLGFTGEDAKKLNASTGDARLKMIETALKKYEASIETYGGSFDALSSTLRDNAKLVLQKATAPLFERVKEHLSRANKWFDDHGQQLDRFAERVGDGLLRAFDSGVRKIAEWTPAIRTFGQHAIAEIQRIWTFAKPFIDGLDRLGKGALASPTLFKGLEAGAVAYGGVKAGRVAAPFLGGLKDLLGSGLGGGASLGGLGEVSASLAAIGGASIIAAAAIIPLAGVIHGLTDASSEYHESISAQVGKITQDLSKASDSLGKVGNLAKGPAMNALDLVADEWLASIQMQVGWLEKAAFGMGRFSESIQKWLEKYGVLETPASGGSNLDRMLAHKGLEVPLPDRGEEKTKKGAGGGGGGTHIQKVEIVVSTNQDPSRIARLTVDRLLDVSRFPTSSPRVRNFSADR